MQTCLEMCDVEGVCTPAARWNMYVRGLCSKRAETERAVEGNPSESWQTILPNAAQVFLYPGLAQFMTQVTPGIFRSRGLSSAGTALPCWDAPPRGKVHALLAASSTTQEPPSGSLTFTSLLRDATFQALLYIAYACIHKYTSARRHSSLPLCT